MKRKRIGFLLFLVFVAAGISGCDKFVQNMVVEETGSVTAEVKKENNRGGTDIEKNKNVSGQVAAPDLYQASVQKKQKVIAAEGTEVEQTIQIISNAPVEVPDVEKIQIKKAMRTRWTQEQFVQWIVGFGGEEGVIKSRTEMWGTGELMEVELTTDNLEYAIRHCPAYLNEREDSTEVTSTLMIELTTENLFQPVDYSYKKKYLDVLNGGLAEIYQNSASDCLKRLGMEQFKFVGAYEWPANVLSADGQMREERSYQLFYERIVDGVPLTYTVQNFYPVNMVSDRMASWREEVCAVSYTGDFLRGIYYENPLVVENFSDEAVFLLPFEEIRQIFENTIVDLVSGLETSKENFYLSGLTEDDMEEQGRQYPTKVYDNVEIHIDKVKLGYMRKVENNNRQECTLIPVWDFIGTWTAGNAASNGELVCEALEENNVSLLTVDASSGIIIQRVNEI